MRVQAYDYRINEGLVIFQPEGGGHLYRHFPVRQRAEAASKRRA